MGLGAAAQTPRQSVGDRLLRIGPWLLLITIALDVVGLVLGLTTRVGAQPFAVQPPAAVIAAVSLSLSYGVVGAILTARMPGNRVGWLLTAVGLFSAFAIFGWYYAGYAFATAPPRLAAADVVIWVAVSFATPLYLVGVLLLPTIFPDGHTLPGRWRWVPAVIIAAGLFLVLGLAFASNSIYFFPGIRNPLFIAGPLGDILRTLRVAAAFLAFVGVIGAAWSLVVRYRRCRSIEERRQLKWIAYAAVANAVVAIPVYPVFTGAQAEAFGRGSGLGAGLWVLFATGAILMPVACLIAITRYRLYAIDRIISSTFVYGALVAILAGLYAGLNDLLKRVFVALTGEQSDAAIVITTLILAMTLTPVRQRLERVAGRRLKSDDAAAATSPPALDMNDDRTRALIEAVADRAAELATQRTLAALGDSEPGATEPDTPITAGSHEA